jgi:hypothetical protein
LDFVLKWRQHGRGLLQRVGVIAGSLSRHQDLKEQN